MGNNNGTKQKSVLLWTIAPLTVFVTLLFVSVNNNALPPRPVLDGARPTAEELAKPATGAVVPAAPAVAAEGAASADTTKTTPMN